MTLTQYMTRTTARTSVWGVWRLDDAATTTLADASGAGHPLTLTGAPSVVSGPVSGSNAIAFASSAQYAGGATSGGGNSQTFECWAYLAALPSAVASLMGTAASANPGSQNSEGSMWINPDGTVTLYQYNGNLAYLSSPAALSLNAWHHIVGVFQPSGMRLRIDKTTVASNAAGSQAYGQRPFWLHGGLNAGGGAVRMAVPSYYLTALTDTEIDAGYDAMLAVPVVATYLDLLPDAGRTLVPVQTSPVDGTKRVYVSPTPPGTPYVGQPWLDTDE